MLYIVNESTDMVLARFDAWSRTCEQDAARFVKENNLKVLRDEITIMGDMVVWVA